MIELSLVTRCRQPTPAPSTVSASSQLASVFEVAFLVRQLSEERTSRGLMLPRAEPVDS